MKMLSSWSYQKTVLALLCAGILFFALVQWWSLPQPNRDPVVHVSAPDMAGTKTYTILVWQWPNGVSVNLDGDYCYDNFGISNCLLVANRSRFSDADIVIFHNFEIARGHEPLPVHLKRPEKQRWVWYTMESPDNNGNIRRFAGQFNWTMTYHRKADIYAPYGVMVPRDSVSEEPVENFIPKKKTQLACWLVSNYKPKLYRNVVYNKLKDVIPIEVYGLAVKRRLHCQSLLPVLSHCYFYLAFENSIFKDYITEKMWYNSFMAGAVPVVLGPSREDYEAVVPKDSFIHVNDFGSIEELGEFLKTLAQDKERYASYFNWKRKYTVEKEKPWMEYICKFCPRISSMPLHQVYKDLDAWQRT